MFIENMYERYLVARWAYLMGSPIIGDPEYDRLEREFKLEYPDDVHSKQPWSFDECPIDLLKKYGLSEMICNPTMGYMAESIYSVNNWEEFESTFRDLNERSRLSFKIDGWNTRVSYFNGHICKVETRGRSGTNLDIKDIRDLFPKTIPVNGRVAITGEQSIPNDKWATFKEMTGNNDQRASVRSAIARGAVDYLSFLAFNIFIENGGEIQDAYKVLNDFGFQTPKYVYVNNFNELKEKLFYMSYINGAYNYLTDGLVIENSHQQLAIRLGAWEEHAMQSYVTGYEESQGMYGTFLNVKCYPISVEGKTFSKISINNIANIVENNLQVGYPIAFNLRSSANVVIDSAETADLQRKWNGSYESYQERVRRSTV